MEQIRTMKKEQKNSIPETNHDYRGNKKKAMKQIKIGGTKLRIERKK
jgi:hypothetical protein